MDEWHEKRFFRFVLSHYNGEPGYFVDIGASYPQHLSNTYLLEKCGWTGLCVDPLLNKKKYENHGRQCKLDKRAVLHRPIRHWNYQPFWYACLMIDMEPCESNGFSTGV